MSSDLRYALRQLARSPGFTVVAILTLALGIGANTSMFSILNDVLLRPLPYPESDHLDRIYRTTAQNPRGNFSPADYLALKPEMGGYGEIAAYGLVGMSLSEPGKPAEMVSGLRASANFFSTLGIKPQLGRDFQADDALQGNHRILLISHRYWQNRFGGDAHIIGRVVRVDGEAYEIIGVLPAALNDWRHLGAIDFYRPLGLTDQEIPDRRSTWVRLMGRRSRTLTHAQTDAFVANFGRRLATDFPAANAESTWCALPINTLVAGKNGPVILSMLVGLSGFVLLIACSNLANFQLARTMARAREFAVRSALGASHSQLLRPLVVESLLLAFAGGIFAILVALWFYDWIAVISTGNDGESVVFALDWRVLGWAFAASVVTALAFGLVPALFALRLDTIQTLKNGARGIMGNRGHRRFRHCLIVGQFALAMILLAGAALFIRGLDELNHRRSGWESDHLVTGTVLLTAATYPGGKEITVFQRLALERLEALPGVASASMSYTMPFFGLAETRKFLVEGREVPAPGHEPVAAINGVSPHYFQTVGTRLLHGRTFNESDTLTSTKVFAVNQAMARGLFGDASPIGRRLAQAGGPSTEWGEIVGVVADVQSVNADPSPVTYQLYQPMAQEARPSNEIAVRASGVAPSTLVDSIRATITALNPDLPVRALQPADTTIASYNFQWAVVSSILSALAVLGLGLASLGIYGVIARTMAERTGEFGIRLALGGQVENITRLVLVSGVKLALTGSALGLLGAFGISRLIAAVFPGMKIQSAPALVGSTLLLVAIALLASWLPARRAARVDPVIALRSE
jgi:putative ABC transport system permease protein